MKTRTLSEHASKQLLSAYRVPFCREELAADPDAAAAAAARIRFPVAVKLCGDAIAHKTERDLVRLDLGDEAAVRRAAAELLGRARPEDGEVGVLVAEMVPGKRELIAGMVRDPQFGPCVLLGIGGVMTEIWRDVTFAEAPLGTGDARDMVQRLRAKRLLLEPFRGEDAADLDALAELLTALGRVAVERPDVVSIDLNPLLLRQGRPVAVDALVECLVPEAPADAEAAPAVGRAGQGAAADAEAADPKAAAHTVSVSAAPARRPPAGAEQEQALRARFAPLFEPRGVVITGVSSHPGKFGFVCYHNLLRFGYTGRVFPLTRDGAEILGRSTLRDISELPQDAADLVFMCTPWQANLELLRACHARGVRAAFIAGGGYGEAGIEGKARQRELVELAEQLGMIVAGPNGQGVISTPLSMCAQIVAPYPPPGGISVASQSGNLVSSFLNYAVGTGVGVCRAVSAGNSAQLRVTDYLEYFAVDPGSRALLAYLEGVGDGRRFAEVARFVALRKPLVLVKSGATPSGRRAAAGHTGSLAGDDAVFDGVAAQCGALRAPTVESAYEWAATFATQPLPRGRRTVILTTAGGWGVLAADACIAAGLEVPPLPEDLREAIDARMPPRWSRGNPIDLAGGETRETIPELMKLIASHDQVDAIIHLGIGIQAAQAEAFMSGPYAEDEGLQRIAAFHRRQDRLYAAAAREASEQSGKPILSATELSVSGGAYGNAGAVGIREEGRLCYPSAERAAAALAALCRYALWRAQNGG